MRQYHPLSVRVQAYMKVGVIGSGPCGVTAALMLLRAGYEVEVLDLGYTENSIADAELSVNQSLVSEVKTVAGKIFPYDFNELNKMDRSNALGNWFTSKGKGGFSTVWGGTWRPFMQLQDPDWKEAYALVDEMVFSQNMAGSEPRGLRRRFELTAYCSCFDRFVKYKDEEWKSNRGWVCRIHTSSVAIDPDQIDSQKPISATEFQRAVWTSLSILDVCQESDAFSYIDDCFVQSVRQTEQSVYAQTNKGQFEYSHLFIAAGPVSTGSLLLRSNLVDSDITLQDTQMVIVPFLSFRKSRCAEHSYALSGLSFDFENDSHKLKFHMQLHAHIETYKDRIVTKFPAILQRPMSISLKFLQKRFFLGLTYLDPISSGSLKLSSLQDIRASYLPPERSKDLKDIKKAISRSLREFGLLPIWKFAQWCEVGESYHLGAANGIHMDDYGQLLRADRIFIAGSFALTKLEPGPITFTAMAQTARLVSSFFRKSPKLGKDLPDL
jgi:hypothetical protein